MHTPPAPRKCFDHPNRERPVRPGPEDIGPTFIERVVLLGYMCSGKSSVGESLARRLDWRMLDFDVEIERREDRAVRAIIEAEGEEYFRSLEAALTEELANEPFVVAAPGGGWITEPRLLEAIRPGTLSIWLHVTPEETARRLMEDSIDRPFRDLEDPVGPISEMIMEREPLYRRADLMIPTDERTVEDIAFEIEQMMRTRGCVRR
jgi:shikimate kinase